jgi:hypothetical protein
MASGFEFFFACRVVRRDRWRGRRRGQRLRVLQVGGEAPWRRLRFCAVSNFLLELLFVYAFLICSLVLRLVFVLENDSLVSYSKNVGTL